MLGSTFIAERDPARLETITSIDDLADFDCLELNAMTTLDFQPLVADGGVNWTRGKPVRYDPDGGMAIFEIDEKGLWYVLGRAAELEKAARADLLNLSDFARRHAGSHLYELASF